MLGPGWFFGRWSRACSATITSLHVLPQQEMLPNFIDVVRWPDFTPLGFLYLFWHTGADLSRG